MRSIRMKLLLLVAFLCMILIGLQTYQLINNNRQLSDVKQMRERTLRAVTDAAELKLAVVQVQQWLTDISATRAAEGYDDGFVQAEAYARRFRELIAERSRLVPEEAARLQSYLASFEEYYELGRQMAQRYIEGGPEMGNRLMAEFDRVASELNNQVDAFRSASLTEIDASITRMESFTEAVRSRTLLASGAAVLLGCALAALMALRISRPLLLLRDQLVVLAAGGADLTQRLSVASRDETGHLAEAFNRFTDSLRGLVLHIREVAEQVASSSDQLARSSQEVGHSVQQVAESVDQIASGGQHQSSAAATSSDAARQMGETVQRVSSAAQRLAEGADEASQLAHDGRAALEAITRQMDQIQKTVGASGKAVQDLGERSRRIGEIVDVITGIAEQTNLLALNAAIEAARAGEQGRGFSVVAEEVRKLAQESGRAASEIAALIAEIRQDVDRAIRDSQAGSAVVAGGVAAIKASGQTFQAIAGAVERMIGQIQQVSDAAGRMADASEQTVRSAEEIAAISQENAAMTQEVASATEEQSSAVEEIASSASDLASVAQELLQTVGAFKV